MDARSFGNGLRGQLCHWARVSNSRIFLMTRCLFHVLSIPSSLYRDTKSSRLAYRGLPANQYAGVHSLEQIRNVKVIGRFPSKAESVSMFISLESIAVYRA